MSIKLGSSNVVAAIYINNKIEVLQDKDGNELTPTVVSFEDGGKEPLVGLEALERAPFNPGRVIFDIPSILTKKKVSNEVRMYTEKYPNVKVVKSKLGWFEGCAIEMTINGEKN